MDLKFFSYVLHPFVHTKNLSINFHDLICFQNFNKCPSDYQEITEYIFYSWLTSYVSLSVLLLWFMLNKIIKYYSTFSNLQQTPGIKEGWVSCDTKEERVVLWYWRRKHGFYWFCFRWNCEFFLVWIFICIYKIFNRRCIFFHLLSKFTY